MKFFKLFKSFSLLFLSMVGVFLFSGCETLGTYNPATQQKEFIFIPTSQEVAMGRDMHKQIVKQYKLSNDVSKVARIKRIGNRLAAISDRQDYRYQFYLIESDQLNAFTTPGGYIYFFTGLMDKLETDDEIASVLAHEIGHCAAKHVIKKYQAAFGYNLIGSIVSAQMGSKSKSAQVFTSSTNTAMKLIFSAYGRQDEYQGDKLGLKYMRLAGYDLNGMIKTLTILQKASKGPATPVILRTHPHIKDRIEKVKEEILMISLRKELND